MELHEQIDNINKRNIRVEADKAWETSWFRRLTITGLTYLVALWFMFTIEVNQPHLNALVPTGGYFLSTLTIPLVKKWWSNKSLKK